MQDHHQILKDLAAARVWCGTSFYLLLDRCKLNDDAYTEIMELMFGLDDYLKVLVAKYGR